RHPLSLHDALPIYGAGKSTLVKLLCGLYRPETGRILVDQAELADIDIDAWRSRIAAAFQDFARLELEVRESVGVGDLIPGDRHGLRTEVPDDGRLQSAIVSAGAGAVLERAGGMGGVLGLRYAPGTELSGGQWQLVALGRAM